MREKVRKGLAAKYSYGLTVQYGSFGFRYEYDDGTTVWPGIPGLM